MLTDPTQKTCSGPDIRELLTRWNDSYVDVPGDLGIHQLIEEQAKCSPDAIAVVFQGRHLTYRELDEEANRLATRLRRRGAGLEVIVGICVERSLEMMVGLLAILKSGAAYLPLDPAFPAERLQFMLEDSKARILLTDQQERTHFSAPGIDTLLIDSAREHDDANSSPASAAKARGPNLAYVIYTSGSTGKPKGVMVEHRQVINFFVGMDRVIGAGPGIWLAVTSMSFDISILELFWTLARGFAVVIQSDADRFSSGEYSIAAQIRKYGITHLQCTPSLARMLAVNRDCMESFGSLRKLMLGGEALSPALVSQLRSAMDGDIINLYGPTETTVWSAAYPVRGDETSIPIGRPIANTFLYVLDENLQPTPVGASGELFIGGSGVARGYLDRPELTAEKFLPSPFLTTAGLRIYRTGDVARYHPDGNVEFLGRVDNQVKIAGLRIEPEEIDHVLSQHPLLNGAAIVAVESPNGEKKLVGYAVPRENHGVTATELRIYLQSRLPKHMVPADLFILESLPTTPNGKIDRSALAARFALTSSAVAAGRSTADLERVIAEVCCDVLSVGKVPADHNFFDLGLASLGIAEVAARLRDVFALEVRLADFFEHPTIRKLAGHLSGQHPERAAAGGPGRGKSRREAVRGRIREFSLPQNAVSLRGALSRRGCMRYVLSSAVISHPGHYEYKLLTALEAEIWLKQGRFTSRVGYKATAQFLDDRFNVHCPLSREPITMQPGDEGLVVRLMFQRPDDPALKVSLKHQTEDWEIGLLKRTA